MDCVGRNWPLAGPAQTPNKIEAPTHSPPASQRHRPRLREHSHSSSVFTGVCCSSRSSTSAKLRAGGRGEGNGEWESSQVVSGDAVRQSPGSTPLGRSILTRRVWRPGCGSARCASERLAASREARGRRVYSEADPGGYYLSALGGRGRSCRCARESRRAEVPAAPARAAGAAPRAVGAAKSEPMRVRRNELRFRLKETSQARTATPRRDP